MSTPRLVVIGSGPAAISAVEAYRERQPEAHIRILTADDRPPYERPPLSKDFLRGDTDDVDLHPRQWFEERAIELTLESPVRRIDVGRRVVEAAGGQFDYDALIVASGASPKPLEVPGGERALLLRSLSHSARLRRAAGAARSAVVIGAGFIGCEAAASLALMGLEVTLVAPSEVPQQKRLGDEAGRRIKALVEATGARFAGGSGVASIDGDAVRLDDGRTITADLVLAATGVAPNGAIAEAAGISLEDGRILVGADMRTNVDGVYAAGDVAKAVNSAAGRALAVEHWQDAMDHGEVAGASAAGDDASWSSVPGFWTEIGDAAVKYHAWGDGYDRSRFVERDGGFTVWYESEGRAVGVLTYESDDDYDLGEELIAAGKPAPASA